MRFAALAVLVAQLVVLLPASAQPRTLSTADTQSIDAASTSSDPFTKRQTVWLDVGRKTKFPLVFPRMNPLPANISANPQSATSFRLTVNDTCGMFTLFHTVSQAAGFGPPPHIHYAEDEYFISAGSGSTRVFTSQQNTQLKPGRLPGFNVPSVPMGSAVLNGTGNGVDKWSGQLVLSPAGNVHYFVRESNITDFFTVYLDGFADADVINTVIYGDPTPQELLYRSGLYGIPHDMTGAFVGYPDASGTQKLYRQARGPVDVPDSRKAAIRLQAMFDAVEKQKCCKTCL